MLDAERESGQTPFQTIYDSFLSLITDDMYMEWGKEETYADTKNMFLSAISKFQFPRFKLYDFEEYDESVDYEEEMEDRFNFLLTREEINIFAHLMTVEWLNRQLASVDVTRQAYSSRDFDFTSQANHLDKLIKLKESFVRETTRLQRLYTRRKIDNEGYFVPNYSGFGGKNNAN